MARLELEITSDLEPDRILAALTDFSQRRPQLWPGLKGEQYRVLAAGDTWADVREGSGGPIWARERYDWSTPGQVTWTVKDSGFATPGDFVTARVLARHGGGSVIHLTWQRRGRTVLGRLVVALNVLTHGLPVRRSFEAGLSALEAAAS